MCDIEAYFNSVKKAINMLVDEEKVRDDQTSAMLWRVALSYYTKAYYYIVDKYPKNHKYSRLGEYFLFLFFFHISFCEDGPDSEGAYEECAVKAWLAGLIPNRITGQMCLFDENNLLITDQK